MCFVKKTHRSIIAALLLGLAGCQSPTPENSSADANENPPAEGFNLAASAPEAIAIADEVMLAMGGRKAWDTTRYIGWNFFGFRDLLWDKHGQQVRIEVPRDSLIILLQLEKMTGKVKKGSTTFEQPDSLAKYLEQGKRIWINDAYWLAMPFKLKDSGVTLSYLGEDTTQTGSKADKLGLTFENVGVTPQNRYEIWVDKTSHLVTQWAYFAQATDDTARIITPWQDYKPYGALLLSGDRGERKLENIRVYHSLPAEIFENLEAKMPQ